MSKVRVYTLSTCPACKRVKSFLKENNVDYTAIDVDLLAGGEQWAAQKEVKTYNPEATYPTVVVEKVVVGFDEAKLREALEL